MNWKQIGLSVLLALFLALNAYVVYQYGYVGFFDQVMSNWASVAVLVDLCIALTMVTVWMVRDARDRGVSPFLYVVLTLFLGSVGPLLYLIRRAGEERRVSVQAVARA